MTFTLWKPPFNNALRSELGSRQTFYAVTQSVEILCNGIENVNSPVPGAFHKSILLFWLFFKPSFLTLFLSLSFVPSMYQFSCGTPVTSLQSLYCWLSSSSVVKFIFFFTEVRSNSLVFLGGLTVHCRAPITLRASGLLLSLASPFRILRHGRPFQ